ncbi:MAG: MFS transporter [Actinobacteria bacterium]|nr:MFS transporter [Actinomycetota bacterium]
MSPRAARWLFRGVAYVYLALLTGTNLPTPLYHGYQRAFGFSPLVLTLIFAAYAGTLIVSLLLAGPLSDAIGRRRVLLSAVGAALAGAICFALADGTAWLFAARAIQGIAVGAASGALTAALVELEPDGNRPRAAMASAMALFTGIGAGPLLSGVLAQYLPDPLAVPYLVEIGLLALSLGVLWRLPAGPAVSRWRPRWPRVPRSIAAPFADAGMMAFVAGAVTGLFLALVPSYLLQLTGSSNLALAGGAVALMFTASAASLRLGYGRAGNQLRTGGTGMVLAGFVLLILAGTAASLALLLAATLVAGAGQGLAFLAALTEVNRIAPAKSRANVLSSFYVVTYLGTGLPVIGAGFLATAVGLLAAVQYFAGAMVVICLLVIAIQRGKHAAG